MDGFKSFRNTSKYFARIQFRIKRTIIVIAKTRARLEIAIDG